MAMKKWGFYNRLRWQVSQQEKKRETKLSFETEMHFLLLFLLVQPLFLYRRRRRPKLNRPLHKEIASLPWLNSFRKTFLLDLNKKFGKETAIADKVEFWLICNWHLKYVSEKNTNNIFGIKLPLKMQCRKLRQL
jgi:hypothetical protein